jgi:hypothetical protein
LPLLLLLLLLPAAQTLAPSRHCLEDLLQYLNNR